MRPAQMSRIHIELETSISFLCYSHTELTLYDLDHMTCSYAIESIHYSCNYAYKDVEQDITLGGKHIYQCDMIKTE